MSAIMRQVMKCLWQSEILLPEMKQLDDEKSSADLKFILTI